VFQVLLVVQVRVLQAAGQEFVVVDLAVTVSVDCLDQVLKLLVGKVLLLSFDHFVELFDSQVTVTVLVHLAEGLAQSVDLLLWELGGDVCHDYGFELDYENTYP